MGECGTRCGSESPWASGAECGRVGTPRGRVAAAFRRDSEYVASEDAEMTLDVSGATEDGAALLDAVDEFVAEYVIYPSEHTRHSHVLWCAHTYLMDCFDSTPRLYFKSPEPG